MRVSEKSKHARICLNKTDRQTFVTLQDRKREAQFFTKPFCFYSVMLVLHGYSW